MSDSSPSMAEKPQRKNPSRLKVGEKLDENVQKVLPIAISQKEEHAPDKWPELKRAGITIEESARYE